MENILKPFVVKLKDVRETKRITYEEIVDGVEKNGDSVSLSTVRKIFANGSEDEISVKWSTIQPVGYFLLGIDETETYNPANARMFHDQAEKLKTDVQERQKEIKHLDAQIEAEKKNNAEKSETINGLRRQIKFQWVLLSILSAALLVFALSFMI